MDSYVKTINELIIDVFHDVLSIEEGALRKGHFSDVTVSEAHTVEAVGLFSRQTMGEVARKLGITVGTLTVAVNNLEKKGYVERIRGETDRRVVYLRLTKRGRVLFRLHQRFHEEMVKASITGLFPEEKEVLTAALEHLHQFLTQFDEG